MPREVWRGAARLMLRMPSRRVDIVRMVRLNQSFAEMCRSYELAWSAWERFSQSREDDHRVVEYSMIIAELDEYFERELS